MARRDETGKSMEFSAKVKDQAYARSKGQCEDKKCGLPLRVGHFAYDHILPEALGGKPELSNCQVICVPCHAVKTKKDVQQIRKADRQRRNHIGATVEPAKKIKSPGFAKSAKTPRIEKQMPPRQGGIYAQYFEKEPAR